MFIVRDGRVAWTYAIPLKDAKGQIQEFSDATMLSNGNVVFARKTGAGEITPDKKLLWNYDAPDGFEVHVAQPLGLDRVMIVQNGNPAKMMIIRTATGQIEKEFVLPTGNPAKTHGQFRRARVTAANTLLAAHMDNNKVAEYDMDGKEIWSVAVPSPWAANRLRNGDTLITSNKGIVREVNPKGETVWEFTQKDVPDIRLFSLQEADRLANGDTVISNWCPNGIKDPNDWPASVQVIEVTPEKKVVWALRSWSEPADLGPATNIQLLDEPGVPENGDQQR
jgi:outer membrane protein assembly factor BamB